MDPVKRSKEIEAGERSARQATREAPQRSHRRRQKAVSSLRSLWHNTLRSWNRPKEGDEKRVERLFEGSLYVKTVAYFGRGRSFSGLCVRAKWVLLLSVVGDRCPSRNRS